MTAFIGGNVLDLFGLLLRPLPAEFLWQRIIYYIFSLFFAALGVCFYMLIPKSCARGAIIGMSRNAFAEPDEIKKFMTRHIA